MDDDGGTCAPESTCLSTSALVSCTLAAGTAAMRTRAQCTTPECCFSQYPAATDRCLAGLGHLVYGSVYKTSLTWHGIAWNPVRGRGWPWDGRLALGLALFGTGPASAAVDARSGRTSHITMARSRSMAKSYGNASTITKLRARPSSVLAASNGGAGGSQLRQCRLPRIGVSRPLMAAPHYFSRQLARRLKRPQLTGAPNAQLGNRLSIRSSPIEKASGVFENVRQCPTRDRHLDDGRCPPPSLPGSCRRSDR
jgi:hypothetical protein